MRLYDQSGPGATCRARVLRRRGTDAEQRLWRALREQMPDCKWRRQVPVGPYVVDLMCYAERLVVEVDGGQHDAAVDAPRTAFLERAGFHVLRFWNNDVLDNTAGVIGRVAATLADRSCFRGRGSVAARTGLSPP